MTAQPQSSPLLSVRDLAVHFPIGGQAVVRAVDGVSFDLARGRTLAIVGESGSGKTTTALSVLRLADPTGGRIEFDGTDLTALRGTALRRMRRRLQLVFQDPYSSLNPRQRAGDIVRAPLDLMHIDPPGGREARVALMFELVGLRPEQRQLYPHQFSGGQRQRLNIARALASAPDLIVCDEPVSALDIAIRAQILNLLRRIQREQSQSFLFISHDMAVVEHVCDDIAVMYLGKIIERATRQAFFSRPLHPYSVALMSAVPTVKGGRDAAARRVRLTGDPPSPVNPPPGCRFAGRCPVAQPLCAAQEPPLREAAPGHHVACHFVESRHGAAVSPLQA
ncbi:Oligopeptide transport ATP-binding protein OppF [Achromobacter deleyi]|uniref:Oligopeptide transport ATP-binding protein OppF n=1 Tax=Achromobacter deleyi TaxID=1353891 RepID=A0A6S7ALI2_9BURK|nr:MULTISPECIES: ABC transporter ATP-binding protein [Achromobacter]CAB3733744.1 Oligopeptide transport ATP-binding protein OppF [Achromobacter deleyi]CAB3908397.1 Oligopeptide transport ATP-binding protein OppF [Achromobacter deleyi]CAB3909748.1 Oligopeptide transport ATP-binding protein OppF [Achromobacter deleyi]